MKTTVFKTNVKPLNEYKIGRYMDAIGEFEVSKHLKNNKYLLLNNQLNFFSNIFYDNSYQY